MTASVLKSTSQISSRQQHGQIRDALHDDKFIFQSGFRFRAGDFGQFRRAEFRGERQFAPHVRRVCAGFFCRELNSKMPRARPNPAPRVRPPTNNFPAPAAPPPPPRIAGFVQRDVLEKLVMRRADFRRAQFPLSAFRFPLLAANFGARKNLLRFVVHFLRRAPQFRDRRLGFSPRRRLERILPLQNPREVVSPCASHRARAIPFRRFAFRVPPDSQNSASVDNPPAQFGKFARRFLPDSALRTPHSKPQRQPVRETFCVRDFPRRHWHAVATIFPPNFSP